MKKNCFDKKGMSWTNLDWSEDRPRGIAFYCNCCESINYNDGVFMQGKDAFGTLKCILCFACYRYMERNTECKHCNPEEK